MLNFFNRQSKEEKKAQPEVAAEKEVRESHEEREIVFSKSIKAGKRLYFLDVKKDRRDEMFLSITESKCKSVGEDGQRVFEKHKIFLYKEDFAKFEDAFAEVIGYIRENSNTPERPVSEE